MGRLARNWRDTRRCAVNGMSTRGGERHQTPPELATCPRDFFGYQLDKVQHGEEPDDWKPMSDVGPGVRDIRVRDEDGAFRVLYVARFEGVVYVLHCFQKKTRKTPKRDLDLAANRYREVLKERTDSR